jgi:long-chain acyl-CoA synthetase
MSNRELYLSRPWLKWYPEGVPPEIEVPRESVPELFSRIVRKYSERAALIFHGRKISYRELGDLVDRFATALSQLGLTKGDRVGLFMVNCPQYVISYFAVLKLGGVVTPISPVYTSKEVAHQLRDSGAKVVICQDILFDTVEKAGVDLKDIVVTNVADFLPTVKKVLGKTLLGKLSRKLEIQAPEIPYGPGIHRFLDLIKGSHPSPPHVEIDPEEDLAALPYTGGTTGLPKAAMLTHRNLVSCQRQGTTFWPILEEGKEVILAFLPFFHIYGQVVVMLSGLVQGFTLVLYTTPDMDEILDALETYQASVFYGVPTLYEYLKEHEKTDRVNWKRLKMIACGADTLHESTMKDWERRTSTRIMEGYGMTETSSLSHASPYHRPKPGTFGVPIPNVLAAIVDPDGTDFLPPQEVGELIVSGPNIMKGYWQRPEETNETLIELEGRIWLRTGDLASMDEEGYFRFFDRKRDLIKYKGYSVFARHVEEVLYTHPMVKAAGVVGVPDPKVGQIIKAYVVLQPEARGKISEEEIIEFCKQHLAHYKVPKIVEFRGELPKTDVGKVSRRELREEAEGV